MYKRKASAAFKTSAPKRRKTSHVSAPRGRNLNFQRNTVGLGPEKKNYDLSVALSPTVSLTTWVAPAAGSLLNGIAQGNTEVTRVGRKVQLKSLDLHYTVGMQPTSTGGGCLRFKVIYDKQSNVAHPTIAELFAADDFGSKNNLANSDRFITIIDHITDPIGVGTNYSTSGRIYKKLGLDTMFTGTGGLIANITTGSMYVVVSQNGFINTTAPIAEFDTRVKFIDI